ncbi:ABC-type lipoprotein export system, ATPase component [Alkalispirochaeta americana]|uniref:ABC-type lipoprotein export system, ATPase component n=1 Tax=Alkalispirochaeta americana TaxID=159291 RepID=A0A1N6PVI2_9SPIO|nr:ATP-binding cassette domain-containing protein [Alkalispirochaeta americana]SIQ08360.1 ABC-type lipoprotein export system, ATPase component [Alkalispirochaeta americana]
MNQCDYLLSLSWEELCSEAPQLIDFFRGYGIDSAPGAPSPGHQIEAMGEDDFLDIGLTKGQLLRNLRDFLEKIDDMTRAGQKDVRELSLLGGHDKDGIPEDLVITLRRGEITGIVGPTGSGKSRLLADIEWLAQEDTPTGRRVLINGEPPDPELRFSIEHRIVAQLSQNMNFVMDTTVGEFLKLHAESRMIDEPRIIENIITMANELAGEPCTAETAVTALSGGQSRALMIADTAYLSTSPIVLIDEIENAGIDKRKALDLLCSREKIVLIATHDPLLALMCSQRLVIRNGAVQKIIAADRDEQDQLESLLQIDSVIQELRRRIRAGERIREGAPGILPDILGKPLHEG